MPSNAIQETANWAGPMWYELHGRLWHTTHPERFLEIMKSGAIVPEPTGIPDADRWSTASGPENFPYVRHIGGVSLFEFDGFNPERYRAEFELSNWDEFVPYRRAWGGAVWVEISRQRVAANFVSGNELRARWKEDEDKAHKFMPAIEAAYLGALETSAFVRALLVYGTDGAFHSLDVHDFDSSGYKAHLEHWRSFFITTPQARDLTHLTPYDRSLALNYNRFEH